MNPSSFFSGEKDFTITQNSQMVRQKILGDINCFLDFTDTSLFLANLTNDFYPIWFGEYF
ncbi:hypothetical protein K9M59_03025 [Candidatus Gracilibacteria bacterium]|nr:hypothetical protein [Candidatus Gracilibacteria bacterium]MCF7819304.1 hypothetical protein [Candidatus Gracilibacteria bacterium]